MAIFTDIFEDVTKFGKKIPTSEYLESGKYPIIDQGQSDIAGYTNEENGLFTDVPVIIFGDHTRAVKYVDTPFFLGADGVKVLKSRISDVNYKYLYYAVSSVNIPNTGYNRHFKWLKEADIQIPTIEKQLEIVETLDKLANLIDLHNQQLSKLDELVKARFVELFGDLQDNPKGYDKRQLKETCQVITGNTPSRAVSEYYGEHIEWIKTDNIINGFINPTTAAESLSEKGMAVSRTVEKDSILMACIAGSVSSIGRVCITDRRVAFNQQINAIVPNDYNTLFLYVMLQISKEYLVEGINMALKGILSKSKLEEKVFIVPPRELQEEFAAFVKQTEKSKVVVQKALDEAQTLFDSLMQEYFG